MDNGNLRTVWKDENGAHLGLQFLGGGWVQYVIFKRRNKAELVSRVAGCDTLKGLQYLIDAFQLQSSIVCSVRTAILRPAISSRLLAAVWNAKVCTSKYKRFDDWRCSSRRWRTRCYAPAIRIQRCGCERQLRHDVPPSVAVHIDVGRVQAPVHGAPVVGELRKRGLDDGVAR